MRSTIFLSRVAIEISLASPFLGNIGCDESVALGVLSSTERTSLLTLNCGQNFEIKPVCCLTESSAGGRSIQFLPLSQRTTQNAYICLVRILFFVSWEGALLMWYSIPCYRAITSLDGKPARSIDILA